MHLTFNFNQSDVPDPLTLELHMLYHFSNTNI